MKKKILAAVFTDNMVFQRDKAVKLFGNVAAGRQVTIDFNGRTVSATADDNGYWETELAPMSAATNLSLTAVCGEDKVVLNNIAIGEVWLAGGQSNMEFVISSCTDWDRVKDVKDRDFNVRFFYTPKFAYVTDEYYEAFDNAPVSYTHLTLPTILRV